MTATTMSSFIRARSTILSSPAPGEGGGVCSYTFLPLLFGFSANVTDLTCIEAVGEREWDGKTGEGEVSV